MATKDSEPSSPSSGAEDHRKKSSTSSKKRKTALDEIAVDLSLPEPPSKKARRALKKGKTLPPKPDSSDDEDDKDADNNREQGDDDQKKEGSKKKERSPYGVWIGNLRFSVTKGDLRKWLVDNSGGSITDDLITRVHMPTTKPSAASGPQKKAPENKGFAYVDFSTFEASVAAMALSETELEGRKLLIKDSKNFDGRPKKETPAANAAADGETSAAAGAAANGKKGGAPGSSSTKIFVGNLSFNVTEDDLRAHFAKCGPIRWVKVATFEDTGKCKGFAWVNFEEADAAAWAVKGFVKVRESVAELEDFMDVDDKEEEKEAQQETTATKEEDESSDDADENEEEKTAEDKETKKRSSKKTGAGDQQPTRQFKTRKWWVNQLLGRTLKIELAEDDQTRYQKRFKKGGNQKRQGGDDAGRAPRAGNYNKSNDAVVNRRIKEETGGEKMKRKDNFATDISVARLTGGVVASQGKKTTFD